MDDSKLALTRQSLAAALIAAGLVLASCSADDPGVNDAAAAPTATAASNTSTVTTDGPAEARVLRVAHIDAGPIDVPTGWFANAVAERSGGALRIELGFSCCGRAADVEQALLAQVASGEADLGWVGVRAFAQAGTTAFEPLITPMLIRSYAAEQAVLESEVAKGLLAQLQPLGLDGLGLVPGSLRYPMSTGASLTTPADWNGLPFYTFESQVGAAAVATLGADPQRAGFDERDEGLENGTIVGLDAGVGFHAERLDVLTHVVADLPFTTRMSALIAAPTLELDEDERRWITEAVADTVARTTELGDIDRDAAADACVHGDPGYVLAGPDAVAEFETALAPAVAAVAGDGRNAATLEALHELVADIPAEPPVACHGAVEVSDTSGVTLRTLIDMPAEQPTLDGGEGSSGAVAVTYESGGLTISGELSLPAGSGPYPAVVLVQPFGGLERARERLVGAGYAVLDTHLRGNGDSDTDPAEGTDLEMGATLDVINAARALAADPRVDSSRIALFGVGLGGLIAINAQVVAPDAIAAVVAVNPSSIDLWENIEYFLDVDDEFRALIVEPRGTPDENPELWADLSPATFIDRVDSPLLILQGTANTANDPAWPAATVATFTEAGKSATLLTFEGADAVLDPSWDDAIQAVESFLAANL